MRATTTRLGRAWTGTCAAGLVILCTAMPAGAAWILNTANLRHDQGAVVSNTDSLWTLPSPTPSIVRLHQHAPGVPGATSTRIDGGACADPSGNFQPLPPLRTVSGQPLDTSVPVPILPATTFHAGEPVFVTLQDPNRNENDAVRETIELHLTTTTGDEERLRLLETGAATGIFAAGIQSTGMPPPVVRFDCRLSVAVDSDLAADYTDPGYPTDTAHASALVDPYGFVFVSISGLLVDGAQVTVLDATTGQPAAVLGDDGISSYPATVTTGGRATDATSRVYAFPPGGFRFPYLAPGRYRFAVTPPSEYVAPSQMPIAQLQARRDPSGEPFTVLAGGSFMQDFVLQPGPAFRIDIPIDPLASDLVLQKTVSNAEASIGDFLQYQLIVVNPTAGSADRVVLTDVLPAGFRYERGSLRIASNPAPDPVIGADGRTLVVALGDLAPGTTIVVSYLVHVGGGAVSGEAINRAQVVAAGGIESNAARASVRVRDSLLGNRATLVGRVVEGECGAPPARLKGVPKVRVALEDGTFVTTDTDGQYHFEGVRSGTHVVQLDATSVSPDLEIVPCIQNSRFAHRAFSQFVEVQGGGLWRADFHLRRKPVPVANPIEMQLEMAPHAAPPPAPATPQVDEYTLNIEFDTALATLRPDAHRPIENIVASLRGSDIQSIRVIAHTDSIRIAARYRHVFADNYKLSEGRAATVASYLATALGLTPDQIFASGWGPDEPVASNATAEGRQKNRRVEVLVFKRNAAVEAPTPVRFEFRVEVLAKSAPVRDLKVMVEMPPGVRFVAGTQRRTGAVADSTYEVSDLWNQVVTFQVGNLAKGGWQRIEFQAEAEAQAVAIPASSANPRLDLGAQAVVRFETESPGGGLVSLSQTVTARCGARLEPPRVTPQDPSATASTNGHDAVLQRAAAAITDGHAATGKRAAIADDATANGAGIDWFATSEPGIRWLFPPADHNPRLPSVRVVLQHEPSQRLELFLEGRPVSGLHFEASRHSADSTRAISIWSGVDLNDGANRFSADVFDRTGARVRRLERTVHYSSGPVRAELVTQECRLIADGIEKPVIAVQFLDREARPVHTGITGPFVLHPPYEAAERVEFESRRALAGLDRFMPTYRVESDDGIAYIELAPTTESGSVVLEFSFENSARPQELRAWLEAPQRDWLLVGFAAGTAGYNALSGDMQALDARDADDGAWADGELRLYAKGRVPGQCLLTLALDLDDEKARGRTGPAEDRRASLNGVIDPGAFYTLYGDGTTQRADAPSQERIYVKLERTQFYALFGDYDTGMTVTELARYSRSLNGLKSVYAGSRVDYTAFASNTAQHARRDEIAGNGTAGPYALARRDLIIGSDKVRLQTRDRFKSEQILTTRDLLRHIDYDIDYSAGTLLFREPIAARDFAYNPVFILADYETQEASDRDWNSGGRAALRFLEGRLTTGASYIRETDAAGTTDLGGVDAKVELGSGTELRLEAARSAGRSEAGNADGDAFLVELAKHGGRLEALLYTRAQDLHFGVRQQNGSETGMRKTGAEAHLRWSETFFADGQAFRQHNGASNATRDVTNAQLRYQTENSGAAAGLQYAVDQTAGGRKFASRQVMLGANRRFFERKLELESRGEIAVGDNANIDFPTRVALQAGWLLTDDVRLTLAQEYANGAHFDALTTRFGAEVNPWKGARVNGTLNQGFGEYGPRTFGVLGLTQALLVGERWGADLRLDQSHTFDEAAPPPVFNSNQPLASGDLSGDYTAVSTGATYRAPLWSWNGRAEVRAGDRDDRLGFTTAFLRQVQDGVAFSLSARLFDIERATGEDATRADVDFSWAHRPLGDRWSWLERLRFEQVSSSGGPAGALRSQRVVQNLSLNRVSGAWIGREEGGDPLDLDQRAQVSLHYGGKYVMSRFGPQDVGGYTDLFGIEARYDLDRHFDVGLQASMLHSWHASNYEYSFGPSAGWSPFDNAWVTLGYNVRGFRDADFDAARYAFQGPFVKLRFKFDQATRLGTAGSSPRSNSATPETRGKAR